MLPLFSNVLLPRTSCLPAYHIELPGYCVFAKIAEGDAASFRTVDAIAAAVKAGEEPVIRAVTVRE